MAMFYDWDEYFLLNLLTGEAERLAGDTIEPTHVTIKTYLEETSKNQTPYQEEVDKASPATLAQLYAAAFCRNDRYTMSRLSSNGAKLPLFYPCYAKGFRLSKPEETISARVCIDLSDLSLRGILLSAAEGAGALVVTDLCRLESKPGIILKEDALKGRWKI